MRNREAVILRKVGEFFVAVRMDCDCMFLVVDV